jgi:predicted metal-dependent hydrolase
MNHSRSFWRLVGSFESDYRRIDRDLNDCWKRIPTWVGLY